RWPWRPHPSCGSGSSRDRSSRSAGTGRRSPTRSAPAGWAPSRSPSTCEGSDRPGGPGASPRAGRAGQAAGCTAYPPKLMSRPGAVVEVDRNTPPTLFHYGEGVRLERLPLGSRIIYPPDPIDPIAHSERAIRRALAHPIDDDPLKSLLRPGMKLTIAFDDLSLPLPPMAQPDVRQLVMEEVLDLAADAGVEDVHLIAANSLHRRMTAEEIRHIVGDRVFTMFW